MSLRGRLTSTGTVFLILFGAFVFKSFIGFTNVTYDISTWVAQMGFTGPQIVIAFLAVIIVLGMVLDGFAILVLTAPVIHSILSPMGGGHDLVRGSHGDRAGDGADLSTGRDERLRGQEALCPQSGSAPFSAASGRSGSRCYWP